MYQQEHTELFASIRKGEGRNDGEWLAKSTLTAIMGREAAYCGAEVNWDTILNSSFKYGPDLLYTDAGKMTFGDFRVLRPPMPGMWNIFKNPPQTPTA